MLPDHSKPRADLWMRDLAGIAADVTGIARVGVTAAPWCGLLLVLAVTGRADHRRRCLRNLALRGLGGCRCAGHRRRRG